MATDPDRDAADLPTPLAPGTVALAGAALSAVAMAAIYVPGGDPSRVYYGTDTHASALFIGAALAFAWPLRQLRAAPRQQARRADAAGLTGIAVLAWAMSRYSGGDGALYPAGLLIAALGAVGLVVAAASPGVIAGLLSWAPLRWAGVRSYGIYLWHWPVITIATAITGPRPEAPWLRAAEAATAITLAAACWKWIEEPILRNGLRATVHARYRAVTESLGAQDRLGTRPCLSRRRAGRSAHGRRRRRVRGAARSHVAGPGAADHPGSEDQRRLPDAQDHLGGGSPGFCRDATAHPSQHIGRRRSRIPGEDSRFEGHRHRGLGHARGRLAAAGCPQRDLHRCGDQPGR